MLYTIENEFLKVSISDHGAEVQSIIGKKTGAEYLWQGDERYWKGRSTVLFPICGRLEGGVYTYGGRTYEMVLHGIAKLADFDLIEKASDRVVLSFSSTEETKKAYPFDFVFTMTYSLSGRTLTQHYDVKNTGAGDLPFSIGGHPGFNVPFGKTEGEVFEDYSVVFPSERPVKKLLLSDACFYLDKTEAFPLENGDTLPLRHSLFDHDAIFLSDMENSASLVSSKNDRRVTVSYTDMTHLGFWHKPLTDAPYICIEPWHGVPSYDGKTDDFATKNEFIHLPAGDTYTSDIHITVEE